MKDRSTLPPTWEVPQVFRDRLGARVGRQRAMTADGHLLLVLHAPPGLDQTDRIGRYFWRSTTGHWASKEFGTGVNALNKHLDEYEDAVAELDRLEEEAGSSAEYLEILERLTPLHRAGRNLYLTLQDARKSCPEYHELIDLRDRAYGIDRTAELLFTATKNALDVLVAKQAEKQSRTSERMAVASHRLNVLAAFFFPIVTLMALFGANLTHGLEGRSPIVFFGVVLLGLGLGVVLTLFITRPTKP